MRFGVLVSILVYVECIVCGMVVGFNVQAMPMRSVESADVYAEFY